MKLRIGGLQTVIDRAAEKGRSKQQSDYFVSVSMIFDPASQPHAPANWFFKYTQSVTRSVRIEIPFSNEAYYRLSSAVHKMEKTNISFRQYNQPDRVFEFQGAWLTELDVDATQSLITLSLAYDYVHLVKDEQ